MTLERCHCYITFNVLRLNVCVFSCNPFWNTLIQNIENTFLLYHQIDGEFCATLMALTMICLVLIQCTIYALFPILFVIAAFIGGRSEIPFVVCSGLIAQALLLRSAFDCSAFLTINTIYTYMINVSFQACVTEQTLVADKIRFNWWTMHCLPPVSDDTQCANWMQSTVSWCRYWFSSLSLDKHTLLYFIHTQSLVILSTCWLVWSHCRIELLLVPHGAGYSTASIPVDTGQHTYIEQRNTSRAIKLSFTR